MASSALSKILAPEPRIFCGDLEYPDWSASFSTLIETNGIPPKEKNTIYNDILEDLLVNLIVATSCCRQKVLSTGQSICLKKDMEALSLWKPSRRSWILGLKSRTEIVKDCTGFLL